MHALKIIKFISSIVETFGVSRPVNAWAQVLDQQVIGVFIFCDIFIVIVDKHNQISECMFNIIKFLPAVVPSYGRGFYVTDLLKQLGPGIWWEMVNMALCT